MRILFFGDSITQGFFDSQGGWVQRLTNDYHMFTLQEFSRPDGMWIGCFNLGISGDTVERVLDRFDDEVKRRETEKGAIVVIAVGINDARMRDNRAFIDEYDFQRHFEKLLQKARKTTNKVMCVGLTAVDESLTDPWPYSSGRNQWSNPRINAFEDIIKQAAMREDIVFVPVHDQFLARLEAGHKLLSDGLHPNDEGHAFIAQLVRVELEKLIA